jgi:hypothetical protein
MQKALQSRRAALGALASVPALALPAIASPAEALTQTDQRVIDLWKRYRRLCTIKQQLSEERDTAEAQLPAWARSGPRYVLARNPELTIPNYGGFGGWPMVADLDRQPVCGGLILARPNIEDLYEQFRKAASADGREKATREFMQSLVAHEERVKQQKNEEERVGYSQAQTRLEEAFAIVSDVMEEIRRHMKTSVLGVAAAVMYEIGLNDSEDIALDIYRATLSAIRPALVDVIAEDADRLARGEELSAI